MINELTERQLWALLLDADVSSEVANNSGNGELSLQYINIGNSLRKELRDKFKINLDDICSKAREQLSILLEKEQEKDKKEKELWEEYKKISEQARTLLNN